jgi:hypothetical protein
MPADERCRPAREPQPIRARLACAAEMRATAASRIASARLAINAAPGNGSTQGESAAEPC